MLKRFVGKVVLVTGGASGIGRKVVEHFAREGAAVVIADIDEAAGTAALLELEAAGLRGAFVVADVSREDDCRRAVETATSAFGSLDVLVNNAGIEVTTPLHELTEGEWTRLVHTNLTSMVLCSKHALRHMMTARDGVILNVASVSGLVAWPRIGAYNATKGGVVMLTKSIAADYAAYGIRANCVCPSIIDTPMTDSTNDAAAKEAKARLNPLGRLGTPEDVADALCFLASEQAAFITGAALTVDGGYTAV